MTHKPSQATFIVPYEAPSWLGPLGAESWASTDGLCFTTSSWANGGIAQFQQGSSALSLLGTLDVKTNTRTAMEHLCCFHLPVYDMPPLQK